MILCSLKRGIIFKHNESLWVGSYEYYEYESGDGEPYHCVRIRYSICYSYSASCWSTGIDMAGALEAAVKNPSWDGDSEIISYGRIREMNRRKLIPLKPPACKSTWDWQGKGETPRRMYFRGQNIRSFLPAYMKAHTTCCGNCGHHNSWSSIKWFWWVEGDVSCGRLTS